MRTAKFAFVATLLMAALTNGVCRAGEGEGIDRSQQTPRSVNSGGTLEGTITYKTDPKRPWRYARFYVKNRTGGPLAETVVALSGSNLKSGKRSYRPKTVTIDQRDLLFTPETTAIRVGDRIHFANSDPGTHNIWTSSSLHPFDVTLAYENEAFETFNRAGGIRRPIILGCRFHANMQAWIYVFDHAYFQVTGKDGRFRFENVPSGRYRLMVVHSSGGLRLSRSIEIKQDQSSKVDIPLSPDNKVKVNQ